MAEITAFFPHSKELKVYSTSTCAIAKLAKIL